VFLVARAYTSENSSMEAVFQGPKDPGSGSAMENLSIFNPQNCYLSSRKYDPGCSSRILIFSLPDPGVKKARDPGSGSARLHVRSKVSVIKILCFFLLDYCYVCRLVS
jgi:hypothetical protein